MLLNEVEYSVIPDNTEPPVPQGAWQDPIVMVAVADNYDTFILSYLNSEFIHPVWNDDISSFDYNAYGLNPSSVYKITLHFVSSNTYDGIEYDIEIKDIKCMWEYNEELT